MFEYYLGEEEGLLRNTCEFFQVDIAAVPEIEPSTGPSLSERIRQRPLRSLADRDATQPRSAAASSAGPAAADPPCPPQVQPQYLSYSGKRFPWAGRDRTEAALRLQSAGEQLREID
eukprot:8545660-Alexandrium_andersonii.AAC.1